MRKREADEPRLFDLPLAPVDDEEREAGAAVRPVEVGPSELGDDFADGESADSGDDGAEEPPRPVARGAPAEESAAREELPLFPGDFELETAPPPPRGRTARSGASRAPAAASPPPPVPHTAKPARFVPRPLPEPAPEPPGYGLYDEDAAAEPRSLSRGPGPAPFAARLTAALADLGVHAAAAGAGWIGTVLLGARLDAADLPALAVYLLAFSFLYSVVSLAFWGRTPGMTAAGVVARGSGDAPLTFGETGLRWLAGVLTAALLGLPLLVALTGRSLADRVSGSATLQYR